MIISTAETANFGLEREGEALSTVDCWIAVSYKLLKQMLKCHCST